MHCRKSQGDHEVKRNKQVYQAIITFVIGVSIMGSGVAYLFAIIFFVIALNFYFLFFRMRKNNKRKKMKRAAIDEARQALWRDKEVARRIEREQDDAYERVTLRNETLALYEQVRRLHKKDNQSKPLGLYSIDTDGDIFLSQSDIKNSDDDEMDPFDIFKSKK